MIDPSLEPRQCLFASLWMRMAWLACWLLHAGNEAFKQWDLSWLWNPEQTSPEVQNRRISGPTKRTDALQIFLQKDENWLCSQNLDLNPTYVETVGTHYEKNYTMRSLSPSLLFVYWIKYLFILVPGCCLFQCSKGNTPTTDKTKQKNRLGSISPSISILRLSMTFLFRTHFGDW